VCGQSLTITRLHCRACDTAIEGRFTLGRLSTLTHEQLNFVEVFLQCEGKIKAVEAKLGLSYPTVRARLREVILALGFEPVAPDSDADDPVLLTEIDRRRVLDDLATGRIGSEEALSLLKGETV
jgi:hypothetical protein